MSIHDIALAKIQREWEQNSEKHYQRNEVGEGIRSSQISALVAYLVNIGVINGSNVDPERGPSD